MGKQTVITEDNLWMVNALMRIIPTLNNISKMFESLQKVALLFSQSA